MKTTGPFETSHRSAAHMLTAAIVSLCFIAISNTRAQDPDHGSLGPNGPDVTWQGTATAPGGGVNTEAACVDEVNCEVFTLTVTGTKADWAANGGKKVQVRLNWASSANEYDIYI